MRNVMIVDDESLVRIGLQSMIDWEAHGYRITGVYKNGEEALAACARQAFDVVLTDIRMPGMDGFELIRNLRTVIPGARVVVLSSYNDFEYTRQAIRLGVSDYISKYEMEPEELLRVLDGLDFASPPAGGSAPSSHGAEGMAENEPATATEARLLLERTAFRVSGEETRQTAGSAAYPALSSELERRGPGFRWVVLHPVARDGGYSAEERKAMLHLAEELFARLRRPLLFGESAGALHGAFGCGVSASAYASAAEAEAGAGAEGRDGEQREEAARMAAEWIAACQQQLNVTLAVGFSAPLPLDGDWAAARAGAEEAADVALFEGGVRFRETCGERGGIPDSDWLELYKGVKRRIQYMQFGALGDELLALLQERGDRYRPAEWVRFGTAAASQLADFLIERYNPSPAELRESFGANWPLAEAAGAARTAAEWRSALAGIVEGAAQLAARKQAKDGWLIRVKQYVAERYSEPIRLEDAAQLAGFSDNHFGQRFRQETGLPFTDYVTEVRIKEAIRLFRETELSTEEIAERVGYANPNYFVKVFKRATGQTIKHFKSGL
ncbi:response regulator transcription factor [Cohnella fermenti]|uniref:Response regulator n=1 Tax=Cohnella fermenti TaxID=2565925 RepID=A0A4S4C365_9BACL|nr:response regulator [Cohnella fermenti]THF82166.1 response regulator [Cohnella fermenti]